MVVRVVRHSQRGALELSSTMSRIAAIAALGVVAMCPTALSAQQPAAPAPAEHTVKHGDTLWDLAKTYLGDSFLWPEIYRVNKDQIEDPHWIYPGEVLKLPGATARVMAVEPPTSRLPAAALPATPAPTATPDVAALPMQTPRSDTIGGLIPAPLAVRSGEFDAAPWVDQKGGPTTSGYIMQAADLTGIASADQSRMNLYQHVLIAPPAGAAAPERQLYLAYRLGPLIEDFGQIVIPTGVIEVTRTGLVGEAATGRVVKMFSDVLQNQRLIPFDTSAALVRGSVTSISNGRMGKVRWVANGSVLPSLQHYLVLDIPRGDANPGDQVELYKPRQGPADGRALAIPELHIAWGQVLRVSPYGATIVITAQEQPKIEEGTAARVAGKIP
jgi:LysM repeat protein